MKKQKKIVIKWENVVAFVYIITTLFKYFITPNYNIITLIIDLLIDTILLFYIYYIILIIRKRKIIFSNN